MSEHGARLESSVIDGLIPAATRMREYLAVELGPSFSVTRMCNTGVAVCEYLDRHVEETMALVPLLAAVNVKPGAAVTLPNGITVQDVQSKLVEYVERANRINEWIELYWDASTTPGGVA